MPHISGAASITVDGLPDEPEAEYELTFRPQLGGTYSGTLHFIDPADGRYQWYTIEMSVASPPPEDKLSMEATVRQAVSLEISLSNPLQVPVTFEVTLEGDGLIGTPWFELGPGAAGTYDILYSPITPGTQTGSITFVSEKAGEFWYEVNLVALPAPPVSLPHMTAAVGYKCSHTITLENPINEEVCVCACDAFVLAGARLMSKVLM